MARVLRIVNGVARSVDDANVTIYDQRLKVVAAAPGAGEILGPITAGTAVTLPSGQTYTAAELEVDFNGQQIKPVYDYNYVGAAPHSQVTFTFDLLAGDEIDFRIARSP